MVLGSFFYKHRAKQALKGNWQTALLVTFFASIFLTIAQVWQSTAMRDIEAVINSLAAALNTMPEGITAESVQFQEIRELYQRLFAAITAIPDATYYGLIAANLLALVITPALSIGSSRYFIARIDGQELGLKEGLLGRIRIWHRALWLYVLMGIKVLLWSLLFVIPGVVAAIRYSMAPYFLAEDSSITAREAIRKSKEAMNGQKMGYFMLQLSFVGWNLLITLVQLLLVDISVVVSLVAAQFISLAVSAYMMASNAAFYRAVSKPDGMQELVNNMRSSMQQMGMELPEENDDGGEDE